MSLLLAKSVNFHKSDMRFSPNVSMDFKNYAYSFLEISIFNNLGNYLFLLINFTRDKYADFSFIKDKVWKAVQGWKAHLFSMGGREVLIKSIVQAILVYVPWVVLGFPRNFIKTSLVFVLAFGGGSNSAVLNGINFVSQKILGILVLEILNALTKTI